MTSELEKTNEAYALAKISGLKYCEFLNRQYGTDYISVMPTNLYGPNDNYHPTHSHVVPALIRRFHEAKEQNLPSVTCWGDGSPLREFLYVDDLANLLDVPILCMGLKDVVVSASPEGILVSDKEQSSYIKPYVNTLDHRVMFAEKSWGSFKVIDIDKASMAIKVTLNAGHQMNYHSHQHRDEVWTVIAGKGKTIVDGMEQNVKAGDVITMSAGCRHTVIAETELKLIEVQLGEAIDVHDKQKFELEY